jgi:hypothetical protein
MVHREQQAVAVDAVLDIARFAREEELGRRDRLLRRLHLHMDVPGAARIEPGDDGLREVLPLGIGVLVTAKTEAAVVVLTRVIRPPEIQQRARYRLATPREHRSAHQQR